MNLAFDCSKIDFEKSAGLVPAVIQDVESKVVLMLGYMNQAALIKTLETGLVTFYSRTRQSLWTKGETSGNFLTLVSIAQDCDQDAVVLQVRPSGPTCHTGSFSCFATGDRCESPLEDQSYSKATTLGATTLGTAALETANSFGLEGLAAIIAQRRATEDSGEESYTRSLFRRGLPKIAQKVGEEATEVIIAALAQSDEQFREESADLLFHFLVLLAEKECSLAEVLHVLKQRNRVV